MSGDDALGDEMNVRNRDPLALDQGTADRLLGGTLDPADAPPAYEAVAKALAAAAAPPRAYELAGEAEALSRFAAGSQAALAGRRARPRRVARAVVATAAVLAVLSVSGIGFATGALPHGGEWLGRTVGSVVGTKRTRGAPATVTTNATTTVPSSRAPGQGPVPATTRPATGPATPNGLCNAWQAGKGKKMQAAAFQALAAAAGGADHIPAYCAALLPPQDGQDQPGPPADPGSGQGSGEGIGRRYGENQAGGQG